jgi:serine/threonine protein kinase
VAQFKQLRPDQLSTTFGFKKGHELKVKAKAKDGPSREQAGVPNTAALRDEDVEHGQIIGRGGFGVVREGTLRLSDGKVMPVAIKMLAAGATEKDLARFEMELRVSHRASERCLRACHIYGSLQHEGELCLVMKLYTRSLHAYLDERRSPDGTNWINPLAHEEVVATAKQILEGLVQLHAQKIVIQDLKPSNILMDEHDQCVISDFGLAATVSSTLVTAQSSSVVGGTPAYKAPEQYDEESFGKISTMTDMWAFGCVVIELLTGFPPWRGKQPMHIMMYVAGKRQPPSIPGQASGALAELLQLCFSHEQSARPTAEQALLAL